MTLELKPTRTARDRVVDLLLVLCAADLTEELKASPGRTTTQKIFFWARLQGATHHAFIRYRYGPYSAELHDDRAWLAAAGSLQHNRFAITPRGSEIARHWRKLLEARNREAFAALDASVRKRAHMSGEQAKKEAYALRVRKGEQLTTLEALPQGESLLVDGGPVFNITADEIEDLHVDLSMPENSARGMSGRTVPWELLPA
jgi:uncharacterized protein YwgA